MSVGGKEDMHKSRFHFALSGFLLMAMAGTAAVTQTDNSAQQPPPAPRATPQPGGSARPLAQPGRQIAVLTRMLNLSPEQQKQILPILADRQQRLQAIYQDPTFSPQDRQARAQDVREDANRKIEVVLNDQQKQQFQQVLKNSARAPRRGRRPVVSAPPPPPATQPQ
jgi:hypothetical protein